MLKRLCKGDITKREKVLSIDARTVYLWVELENTENYISEYLQRIKNLSK